MTTTTTPAASTRELPGVSFGGILVSEWIKLRSLRSTVWCYIILIVITIGLSPLVAFAFASQASQPGVVIDAETSQSIAAQVLTASIGFSQLVISVLGALVITGEYGTGMIRSTFTAVPKRLPALFGKAAVFAAVTFVVSFVALVIGLVVAIPVLGNGEITVDLGDGALWLVIVGGAAYLALIGLFSLAVGAIIRNSAGGIAASLGAILVLPTIISIFTVITQAEWVGNLSNLLPSNAGARMFAYPVEMIQQEFLVGTPLEPWQGALVLLAWIAALFALASVLLKRRDA
jgi:ABC-2 type transport system permease protein